MTTLLVPTDPTKRLLTPNLFTNLISKTPVITQDSSDPDMATRWVITFTPDLSDAELILARWIAYGTTATDAIASYIKAAVLDNKGWNNNSLPSLNTGADQIINATTGVSSADKQLAQGVKVMADQIKDLNDQMNQLMAFVMDRVIGMPLPDDQPL